jgi:hypothetical protein
MNVLQLLANLPMVQRIDGVLESIAVLTVAVATLELSQTMALLAVFTVAPPFAPRYRRAGGGATLRIPSSRRRNRAGKSPSAPLFHRAIALCDFPPLPLGEGGVRGL